eukprot:8874311-Ditylum_brightwellii.AAC.1
MGFRQLDYKQAFIVMGCTIIASSFLSVFIRIKGHAGLICGQDDLVIGKGTLSVPEPEEIGEEDEA